MLRKILAQALVRYLSQPVGGYERHATTDAATLSGLLKPADVLLVEGEQRLSVAVKYLTQSTWSHAALFVGDAARTPLGSSEPHVLVEADLENGVVSVPISKYECLNTRICRPIGLTEEDRARVIEFILSHLGDKYDLKNVVDLARYLLPTPPVPTRWRRGLLALGSGDPTRAICSVLVAMAFQAVRYPILPIRGPRENSGTSGQESLHVRHHSLFTPRDFDVSPYFKIIKPTIEIGFEYKKLSWDD